MTRKPYQPIDGASDFIKLRHGHFIFVDKVKEKGIDKRAGL
jgi:hypothetical protein